MHGLGTSPAPGMATVLGKVIPFKHNGKDHMAWIQVDMNSTKVSFHVASDNVTLSEGEINTWNLLLDPKVAAIKQPQPMAASTAKQKVEDLATNVKTVDGQMATQLNQPNSAIMKTMVTVGGQKMTLKEYLDCPVMSGKGSCFVAGTWVWDSEGHRIRIELAWLIRVMTNQRGEVGFGQFGTSRDMAGYDRDNLRIIYLEMEEAGQWSSRVRLLRDETWVQQHGAKHGERIRFQHPEMRIDGWATVTLVAAIRYEDLPVGPGKLVTAWFEHRVGKVYELRTVTADGMEESLFGTPTHPFGSQDSHDWVPLSELKGGEQLFGFKRSVAVLTVADTGRTETVYNIEVDGDHCYRVGQQGVLVHNASNPVADFESVPCNSDKRRCTSVEMNQYKKFPNQPAYTPFGDYAGGVTVYITARIPAGEKIALNPPGWDSTLNTRSDATVIARGHVLAQELGGLNKPQNAFTICQNPANSPFMSHIENEVAVRVGGNRKESWYYQVKLEYNSGAVIPARIKIRACTYENDTSGNPTGEIYQTTGWLWNQGIQNPAGIGGIGTCQGA